MTEPDPNPGSRESALPPPPPPPAPPPPASAPVAAGGAGPTHTPAPVKPIGELGRATQIAVGVASLLSLGLAWAQWNRRGVLDGLRNNVTDRSLGDLVAADDQVGLFAVIWLVTFLVSGVVFLTWFRRAYGNLAARGHAKHAPGWSIGAWFVPFLNLWRPPKMTQELLDDGNGEGTHPTGLLIAWWGLMVLGWFLDRGFNTNETLDDAINSDTMGAIGGVLWSAAGAVLFVLIGRICTLAAARATD